MKHIVKILSILVAIAAFWIGLLHTSIVPQSQTWLGLLVSIIIFFCFAAAFILDYITGMLWPIDGWHRFDALSNLPPRSSIATTGTRYASNNDMGWVSKLKIAEQYLIFLDSVL
uniref:Uncharacterized protein n=1 Tax=Chenopodium quinoa TaxID=63459 RepID=A0A803LNL7_CHEQI